jgi:hypothetical protein
VVQRAEHSAVAMSEADCDEKSQAPITSRASFNITFEVLLIPNCSSLISLIFWKRCDEDKEEGEVWV